MTEPVAIIGLGCRFPGAKDPEAFWQLLCGGVDAIGQVPADRWDVDAFYDANPATPGKTNTRWGGFLDQVDQFDFGFFGISPREAARMDPQQRLLLEVAWEALQDAGQAADRLAGSQTGVFVGISTNEYSWLHFFDPTRIDAYAGTGNALSIAANRVSYLFDFRGPSMVVDTACSASLVAVHLACCSLWNRESELALAGGVNLILSPAGAINFSKAGAMAPDGRCKAFDARADGYVRSEGAGVVALKLLSRALADEDPIYAVIRGSAVNQDGRTNGILAPSRWAQEAVLREACRRAGISPGQVDYVEAHGTGTFLGDPIEARALGTVLAIDRLPGGFCTLGSVKTNIGHLEAAAGIAGLIKVALMLKHRLIPPSLHFHEPNPHIPFAELPLRVQKALGPWPDGPRPALAGVSSFGFGGTNAHVVVEEAPPLQVVHQHDKEPASDQAQLLPMSARSPESLRLLARAYQGLLATEGSITLKSLRDVCYTASVRQSHHDHRLALVFHSREELAERLEAFLQGEARPGLSCGRKRTGRQRKLVFVFPGQGPKWWPLGRELLEQQPAFRASLERCGQLLEQRAGWSLLEELTAADGTSHLDDTSICQPALFALQLALAALWRSWGIVPDAVVGHSMGEVAAAHVAGALSLEDAVNAIYHRGRLIKSVVGRGKMAVVGLPIEQAQKALAGYEDRLAIAASNSPLSTVLSGEPAALGEVLASLGRNDVFCRVLESVDFASHSPQMEPLQGELLKSLDGLQPQPESIPIFSTVTGEARDGRLFDAEYWARNVREPVLFSEAATRLLEDDHDIFLELSPHPILSAAISQCLHCLGREATVLPSVRRGEEAAGVMLGSLGALYALGYPVDWRTLYPSGGRCVRVPSYAWQRERCWLDIKDTDADLRSARTWRGRSSGGKHPLLGAGLKLADTSRKYVWETELQKCSLRYLDDHRVQGAVVLPGTAYIEMALAAAEQALGMGPRVLREVDFRRALFLPESGGRRIQVILSPDTAGGTVFCVYSCQADADGPRESWILHATGKICPGEESDAVEQIAPDEIRRECREEVSGSDYYRLLDARGLQYGPCFQGIDRLWRRDEEALGRLQVPGALEPEVEDYALHPAILDSALQVLGAALPVEEIEDGTGGPYLPVSVDQARVYGRPGATLWSHARFRARGKRDADTLEGDVQLFDDGGFVVAEVLGFRLRRLERQGERVGQENLRDWLYELQWEPKARPEGQHPSGPDQAIPRGSWLIFADTGGVGKVLAALLAERGQRCVLVYPGEAWASSGGDLVHIRPEEPGDMQALLAQAFGSDQPACRGVVHLWSLDAFPSEETTPALLETAQTRGCGSVLFLIQALAQISSRGSPRVWLVTRGAQPVNEQTAPLAVAQAPLWGLGRTLALEHAVMWGGLVDLDPAAPVHAAAALLQEEIWSPDGEDQLAYRQGQRYAARLVRKSESGGLACPLRWRPDGSYLVTGGLGDLGLLVARWMVEQGARRVILLGRTKVPPRCDWDQFEGESRLACQIAAIRKLEAMGASVHLASVDVADEVQLSSFLQDFRRDGWPPIRGVVHAAGVVHGQTLLELDADALRADFRPKAVGGWLLDRLLEGSSLDFFVCFSSAAALVNSPFLGSYAAANAFLDALAHYRRAKGRPALSVNWGFWGEVGMAARYLQVGRRVLRGMESFTPGQGLELLGQLLRQSSTQVAVMAVNWSQWRQFHQTASELPLFSHLFCEEAGAQRQTGSPKQEGNVTRSALLDVEPGERRRLMESYLRKQVAQALGLSAAMLDVDQPLTDLGLDSVMIVEIKNRIEAELGTTIPVVKFFEAGDVARLTKEVLDQMLVVDHPQDAREQPSLQQSRSRAMRQKEAIALHGQLMKERGKSR